MDQLVVYPFPQSHLNGFSAIFRAIDIDTTQQTAATESAVMCSMTFDVFTYDRQHKLTECDVDAFNSPYQQTAFE